MSSFEIEKPSLNVVDPILAVEEPSVEFETNHKPSLATDSEEKEELYELEEEQGDSVSRFAKEDIVVQEKTDFSLVTKIEEHKEDVQTSETQMHEPKIEEINLQETEHKNEENKEEENKEEENKEEETKEEENKEEETKEEEPRQSEFVKYTSKLFTKCIIC